MRVKLDADLRLHVLPVLVVLPFPRERKFRGRCDLPVDAAYDILFTIGSADAQLVGSTLAEVDAVTETTAPRRPEPLGHGFEAREGGEHAVTRRLEAARDLEGEGFFDGGHGRGGVE